MIEKSFEKQKAIALRREGKTYSQILQVVPVAKSTISLWFKDVGLSIPEKQNITAARLAASKRGGIAKHAQKVATCKILMESSKKDIGTISKRELFLLGSVLYWAEGNKEKRDGHSSQLMFSNMDTRMIRGFLRFLKEIFCLEDEMINFELYLHQTHLYRLDEVKSYWVVQTGFSIKHFNSVYIKKTDIKTTNRKNTGAETYFGVLRIKVKKSSTHVRKLAGWAEGIYDAVVLR